jgi:hypothetical protein
VLTLEVPRRSESKGNQGVREGESARPLLWTAQGQRIEEVATDLRPTPPESVRRVQVRCRTGETQACGAVTNPVRLKRSGRNRMAMGHERAALRDTPRLLVTDARPGERGRILETWSFRWAAEVFPEVSKQGTGGEAAQVRTEAAVTRLCRFRCLAPSLRQRAPRVASPSAHFAFATGERTFGPRGRPSTREVFLSLLSMAKRLFAGGYSCAQVAAALRPACFPTRATWFRVQPSQSCGGADRAHALED